MKKWHMFCLGLIMIISNGCGTAGGGDPSPVGPSDPLDTTISLQSTDSQVTNGATFTVAVKAYNVTNLFGAGFDLSYDKSVVEMTGIQDGGFLLSPMTPLFSVDSQSGYLVVGVSSQAVNGVATGVSGTGTLCNITFKAKALGSTTINVVSGSAKYYDSSLVPTTPNIGSSVDITVK